MSGYRQSGHDPDFTHRMGQPLRPYNGWQWLGVVFAIAGLAIALVYFAERLGWIPTLIDSTAPVLGLVLAGVVLINSRRQPATDPAPELAAARKRWLVIIVAVCAAILGLAIAIDFLGAN